MAEKASVDVPVLVERMKSNEGISLKDIKYICRTYEKSFTGKEAVEWLMKNVPNTSSDQAVALGKQLLTQKAIKNATGRKVFSNSNQIFQFSQAPARSCCGFTEASISSAELPPEELFEVYQLTVYEAMYKQKPGLRGFIVNKPTATGQEVIDFLSTSLNVNRQRATEIAQQLFKNKYMATICGASDFLETRPTWYIAGNLEYLNAIDRAEELQLSTLVLKGGSISWVPARLADLPNLKTLDLSNNDITIVCQNISFLPNLEELLIANNKVSKIIGDLGLLKSLKKLDLRSNVLESLPASISQLVFLETFLLDNNKLKDLPKEYSSLTNMKTLSLANNLLKAIPECVAKYEKLFDTERNLQDNVALSAIPAFVAGLVSLQEIRLENNDVEELPAYLGGLPKIRHIGLKNNTKIHCPPQSLVDMGSEVIINYLKDLQDSTIPCFCGKMLILGMENVGKTSLLQAIQAEKRFLRSPRSSKFKNLSTDGINILRGPSSTSAIFDAPMDGPFITEKKLFRKRILERLYLNIWDFAGQDTYYTTHEFFLTDNSVYAVVWDIRKPPEESRVDFWLKSIQARAPNAPVILIGTHVDLVDKNKLNDILAGVEATYTKKYPQIAMIECVSTTTMEGIQEFKKDLRKLAMEQPFIRNRIPGKHYGLAQAVVEKRKALNPPIATYEEYKEVAKLVYVTDPKNLDVVTRHLHELGFLMHFREESLKSLVILSPQWLSDCFSSIVTVKNTFCKNGRLPLSSLPLIWKSEMFPPTLQGKLLRILEVFEVLFIMRRPNSTINESEAIVPSLLPVDQPATLDKQWADCMDGLVGLHREHCEPGDGAEKEAHHTFGRKFEFSFITRAFFARLLVRLLHVGKPIEYWRQGIFSKKNNAYSLVKFNQTDCVLIITVKSHHFKEGAELFSQLLDNVNTLISDWPRVNAKVTVPCICSDVCHREPHQYELHDIENQLLAKTGYIVCPKTEKKVCLDGLAPDLSLANLKGNKIDSEEITNLEHIGSGSFAEVFKGAFRGEVVAVKQLILDETDSISRKLSDVSSLSSGSLGSSMSDSMNSMDGGSVNSGNGSVNHNHLNISLKSLSLSSLKGSAQSVSQSMIEYLHEFRREVVLMSTLTHENIVNMKGFCYEPYSIVMEYMDQGSLSSYIKNNKDTMTWSLKLNLALDVARGVQFLHNTSPPLVHRDLKGPNVLLKAIPEAPYVQAKISDFGLSRTMVSGFVTKVVDNPRWCAPEMIRKAEYDEKSDVYSFAIVLWEILTGEHPFGEYDSTIKWTHVLEDKIVHEGLRPTIPSDCPPAYASLIKRSWVEVPSSRPSFAEIVPELEAMLRAL